VRKLFETRDDLVYTFVRLTIGGMIWAHGAQKMLGWFGGKGWDATVNGMNAGMGIPVWLGSLVVIAEFFGGLSLILGFFARFSAFWTAVVLLVAAALVHLKNGFFAGDNGVELHVLYATLALVTIVKGAGALSIDRWIASTMGERSRADSRAPKAGQAPKPA
jgi:putative oxidoreductase